MTKLTSTEHTIGEPVLRGVTSAHHQPSSGARRDALRGLVRRWFRRAQTAIRNPEYAGARLRLFAYELTHPGEPWIAAGATRYLDRHLDRGGVGLEWGSGRSTLWFAERLRHLTSVEHDRAWYEKMAAATARAGNIDYRHVALEHSPETPTRAHYEVTPKYVQVADELAPAALSFVAVDGHYRQACVIAGAAKLAPGGLLMIDNWNRLPADQWGVPADFELVHLSSNAMTCTAIWQRLASAGGRKSP